MDLAMEVKLIDSPYVDIQSQIRVDAGVKKLLSGNADIKKYNMSEMLPKVTYDDWMVCHYLVDDKLYYIDEECVTEVVPVGLLEYNCKFEAVGPDGKVVPDDKLDGYYNCLCCGEADDMTCYVYFDERGNGNGLQSLL